MHKKVPCIELTFSVFLLSFLLLFTNVNLASAQEMRDAQDCASNQVPEIGEILRLGLTPSLKDSDGAEFSSQFRTANVEGLTPKSGMANTGSDPQLATESDAQLSAKRVGQRAMYRLYNPYTGEHFYTADEQERDDVAAAGWRKESIGWVAPKTSSTPVYRLYNKYAWDHHYTPSAEERDNLVKKGWIDEGIGWYSADEGSLFRAPVYRQYNPNAWVGTHNYTLSTSELNNLVKAGWRDEGVGYYGLDQSLMSELDFNDIKVTTTSKVYNGKAQTQTITSTNQKLDEDYIVEYANNKNVGTATITITGINGFYGEKVYTFKITQKTISQVKWGDLEFGYDGKAHIPTATAVGLCSGDSATITVTASGNHTDTGTYTATATAISNKNYKLASGLKTDFRIGTKIDFDKDNKPTVNTNDEVYTGSAITKDVSVAGLTKDKDYTVTYTNNVNVGTATLTIKGIGEYFGEKSYTFKITQKSLSGAAITPEALTYNGSEQTVKISKVTLDGKTLKEGTDFQVTSGNKGTNAGTYEGLTLKGIGNYKDTASGSWAISPKTVGIDWSDTSITYDGTPKSPTAKVTGVCGSDTVTATVVVAEPEHTNIGTYNATTTELDNANYQLPNPNPATTFVIVAKEPTEEETKDIKLSLPGVAYVYDKTPKEPDVKGIPAGFIADTDYEIVYSDNVNAGENTAKVTVKFKGNYTGEKVLTFSIAKATLTIYWSNTTFTYDTKTHAPTAEIASGKIDGDTITLSVSGEQTNANKAGESYIATANLDKASQLNYKIAEGDEATNFKIGKATLTIKWSNTSLTYNASAQKPTAEIESGVQGSDTVALTVKGEQTNANSTTTPSYTATAMLEDTSQVNYQISDGTETVAFTIAKASKTPSGLTTGAEVNQTLSQVTLPSLPDGFDGTISWEDSSAGTGTVPDTTVNKKAVYTPNDTSNYEVVTFDISVYVDYATYTVLFHGNGGTTADDKDSVSQICRIGKGQETLEANSFENSGNEFVFWTVGSETSGDITAANYKTVNTYFDQYSFSRALESATQGSTVHLYAHWIAESTGDYWIAAQNAITPDATTEVLKTQTEIDASKTTSSFWTTFYNNNSHLYTIWHGSEVVPYASRFVEFRIIQVGAHDADGSTVTFMATNALPTAKAMNSSLTNEGGWSASALRDVVTGDGNYVKAGLSGLASAVKTISKKSTAGSLYTGWTSTSTNDDFWILSGSELSGNTTLYKSEGAQYTWFSGKVAPASANSAIANFGKTRSGSNPSSLLDSTTMPNWWLRSVDASKAANFYKVDQNGKSSDPFNANVNVAVLPCFAF